MEKITSVTQLRESIRLLEMKKANEGRLLKEQIKTTYECLKPANLIKSTLHDLALAPNLKGDLMNATLGLAAGYLSKKVIVGSTHNPLKQLLGTFLQMGVTNIFLKNADGIKSGTMQLITTLFNKRDTSN